MAQFSEAKVRTARRRRMVSRSCKSGAFGRLGGLLFFLFVGFLLMQGASASPAKSGGKGDNGGVGHSGEQEERITIGIDLGTTYSCAGMYHNGKIEILPNDMGNRITPSYVSWNSETGERNIGDAAKNQAQNNPSNTIFDVKRLIGRQFSDRTVQNDAKLMPYKIVDKGGRPFVQVNIRGEDKQFAPEEISAMVLGKMRSIAEAHAGMAIHDAVITVPAYFNDGQRQATKDAGKIAGLNVRRIVNEPTAAAVAYGLDNAGDFEGEGNEKNVLVYDLGGGTFDVTLLTIEDGVYEVHATSGDTHLGGEDFDARVMKYVMQKFEKSHPGHDARSNPKSVQKLRHEIERVKRSLSSQHQARIEIEAFVDGIDLSEVLTRARFEELNADLFKRTLKPVKQVLEDARMTKADIDEIVLVGGSTRIPKVQELLRDFFNGKEPNKGINPDEAVAYGAAVRAASMDGHKLGKDGICVIDATPLSLGIETVGGVFTKVIPRGTTVPTQKAQTFSTYQDNQQVVGIRVFEGERGLAKDNHALGSFELTGIPPAPRGTPQIEVRFEVNNDNILKVTAEDKSTGRKEKITIARDDGNRLSEAEIERALEEAKEAEEADKLMVRQKTARIALEGYCYRTKKDVNDGNMGALDASSLEQVNDLLSETLDWLEDDSLDYEDIKEKDEYLRERISDLLQDTSYQEHRGSNHHSSKSDHFSDDEDDFGDDWEENDDTL